MHHGFLAINTATTAIKTTDILAIITGIFLPILIWNSPEKILCDTLEDAARSCESAVDIVEASIPARITPAIMAKIMPCVLNTWAI